MERDPKIQAAIEKQVGSIVAPRARPDLLRRARLRMAGRAFIVVASVTIAGSAFWIALTDRGLEISPPERDVPIAASTDPEKTPSPREISEDDASNGRDRSAKQCLRRPVAGECGERDWALRVARRAGFEIVSDDGSAPEVRKSSSFFHFWAFVVEDKNEDRSEVLRSESYWAVGNVAGVAGVPLYFDGTRITWEVHGLYVWVSAVELDDLDPSMDTLKDLVRASKRIEWP